MKKLIIIFILMTGTAYADISVTGKFTPKNDGFTGLVDGDQVLCSGTVVPDACFADVWINVDGGTLEIPNSTTLPGLPCNAGEIYMDTNATSGQQLYGCEAGSWVLQGDGGGGGAETNSLETVCTGIADDEVPLGSAADDTVYTALPSCYAASYFLTYNDGANTFGCAQETDPVLGATVEDTEMAAEDFGDFTCTGAEDGCTVSLAATATALAANPADCAANQFANAIAASGALTCAAIADADVPDGITVTLASTATALAANPADCAANQFANAIAASGALTCAAIADADVPNDITINSSSVITSGVGFDAIGAVDLDYGSVDVTDHTFITDSTGNTEIVLPNDSIGDAEIDWGAGAAQVSVVDLESADNIIIATEIDTSAELAGILGDEDNAGLCAANTVCMGGHQHSDTKCAVIETPTDADNFLIYYANAAITITSIECIVEAATSAVITLQECDVAGDNCSGVDGATTITCDVGGQADDGGLSNGSIDATDWVRVDIGTVTGTVGHVTVCFTFNIN